MKIGAFTIITNPEYRQDPWVEWTSQALLCFEKVVIVYGREEDGQMIAERFGDAMATGKLIAQFLLWPQPEWSFEELPKHLNLAIAILRDQGCDWSIRMDSDTAIHEKDKQALHDAVAELDRLGMWIGRIEKLQFFNPKLAYEKRKIPVLVNIKKPIAYGFDLDHYNDLCQPIKWDGKSYCFMDGKDMRIPVGRAPSEEVTKDVGGFWVWNYDYTFKTEERAAELLYHFDRAHARFWGQGYSALRLRDITPESAMKDFLILMGNRYQKMYKKVEIKDHPLHFQKSLENLTYSQFGHSSWGKLW